jgi:hypothetical protein
MKGRERKAGRESERASEREKEAGRGRSTHRHRTGHSPVLVRHAQEGITPVDGWTHGVCQIF